MLVQIDCDEVWPVYSIQIACPIENDRRNFGIEIPTEIYEEYISIKYKYQAMQEKLRKYHEQFEKVHRPQNPIWPTLHEGVMCVYGASLYPKRIRPS
jgi:hypothetical protein